MKMGKTVRQSISFGTSQSWHVTLSVGLLIILVGAMFPGCVSAVRHEALQAADVAEKFANEAYVHRDFDAAFVYLAKEKVTLSNDALEKATNETQGTTPWPTRVVAIAYEIPFGQRAVVVYLRGDYEGGSCFYRIVTVGDASSGYTVMELQKANMPFPKSPLQVPIP